MRVLLLDLNLSSISSIPAALLPPMDKGRLSAIRCSWDFEAVPAPPAPPPPLLKESTSPKILSCHDMPRWLRPVFSPPVPLPSTQAAFLPHLEPLLHRLSSPPRHRNAIDTSCSKHPRWTDEGCWLRQKAGHSSRISQDQKTQQ
mmetsp:Transcript_11881/g.27445  ORF Transcript_11881/g.27445 Transcript_11881/m.27445 type:complete len:144 (-) Transcript_11881:9-440(-)